MLIKYIHHEWAYELAHFEMISTMVHQLTRNMTVEQLNTKCFVCERIEDTFKRYIDTIIYLYKQDESFRKKYNECQGFCTQHYGVLIEEASSKMSGQVLNDFVEQTNRLYLENMKRVRDDVEWFINKFDHKYADEPWKNAKDSLTRAMIKTASVLPEAEKKKK